MMRDLAGRIAAAALAALLVAPAALVSQEAPAGAALPDFEAFPVDSIFSGRPASVELGADPPAGASAALREAARQGPNFAGHLRVVSWGCGTGCQVNAVVDARTGRVHPQALITAADVEFRLDSRLLIADPPLPAEEQCPTCGVTAAYVWCAGRLEPHGPGPHPHLQPLP